MLTNPTVDDGVKNKKQMKSRKAYTIERRLMQTTSLEELEVTKSEA